MFDLPVHIASTALAMETAVIPPSARLTRHAHLSNPNIRNFLQIAV
jgi:hypothetical protein